MIGSEIRPIEITAAATTPVVAASNAPTSTTATAKPPRTGPNTCATVSSSSSAMRLRSRIIPIKVKNGMANRVSLPMIPATRSGRAWNRTSGMSPNSIPKKPYARPVAASEKATGKPIIKKTSRPTKRTGTKLTCKNSTILIPLTLRSRSGLPLCVPKHRDHRNTRIQCA